MTMTLTPTTAIDPSGPATGPSAVPGTVLAGAVTGAPRAWLRLEGLAVLGAAAAAYLALGGPVLLLPPLLLVVDVSMLGYLAGPRVGATVYNLGHSLATGIVVAAAGWALGVTPLLIAGLVLAGHSGMDRLAGYGLKYPTSFHDTHLGRIGRIAR
jgi:hypothetical protein